MDKSQDPEAAETVQTTDSPAVDPSTACSVSVGVGQHAAAALWKTFKEHELTYVDMLEAAACLIVNVADKTESTDHEIHSYVWKLTTDMRANAARSSKPNSKA